MSKNKLKYAFFALFFSQSATWVDAQNVGQLMPAQDRTICAGENPGRIFTSGVPRVDGWQSAQWFSQLGVQSTPRDPSNTNGWTLMVGGSTDGFAMPDNMLNTTTFVCLLSKNIGGQTTKAWVGGRKVIIVTANDFGSLNSSRNAVIFPTDPPNISFARRPSNSGAAIYQWYFIDSDSPAPNGTSSSGWSLIQAANASSYNPPAGLNSTRTYACMVNNQNAGACAGAHWASGAVTYTERSFGAISGFIEKVCPGGTPNRTIVFSKIPAGASSYTYRWYYKQAIVASTEVLNDADFSGWTRVNPDPGLPSYLPKPGSIFTFSYKCHVSFNTGQSGWAANVAVVEMNPLFLGAVTSANQTIANFQIPTNLSLSSAPSGVSNFRYDWYFKNGIVPAPTGGSTTGWTLFPRNSLTDRETNTPVILPLQNTSRTFACFVTPIDRNPSNICGSADWAAGARQITVTIPTINFGTLASGNQTLRSPADAAPISLSIAPTGAASFSFQWYSQLGLFAAPVGNNTAGWTAEAGATSATFDPPAGRTSSRTYACIVTPSTGTSGFASGVRQITVTP